MRIKYIEKRRYYVYLIGLVGIPVVLGGVAVYKETLKNKTTRKEKTEREENVEFNYWEKLAFIISVYNYFGFKHNNELKYEEIPKVNYPHLTSLAFKVGASAQVD